MHEAMKSALKERKGKGVDIALIVGPHHEEGGLSHKMEKGEMDDDAKDREMLGLAPGAPHDSTDSMAKTSSNVKSGVEEQEEEHARQLLHEANRHADQDAETQEDEDKEHMAEKLLAHAHGKIPNASTNKLSNSKEVKDVDHKEFSPREAMKGTGYSGGKMSLAQRAAMMSKSKKSKVKSNAGEESMGMGDGQDSLESSGGGY